MATRTAQLSSARIRRSYEPDPAITISGFHLGADTSATPANPTQTMAPGYDRRTGRQFDIVVDAATPEHFTTLDTWQRNGELVDIMFTYTDGTTAEYFEVGFTAREVQHGTFGEGLEGVRLEGVSTGVHLESMLELTPALDGDGGGDGDGD